MRDLVLVTQTPPHPEAPGELAPLLKALAARGVTPRLGGWDDPTFDWSTDALAVLRTPWNYHLHVEQFLAWTKRVPHLLNPPAVVAWNAKKTYLRELEDAVPTEWLDEEAPLDALLERRGWREAVLKPAVSAGSFRTRRFVRGAAPQALLAEILTAGTAMVQPYLASVETSGERSLVFFEGELSHAVKRLPPLETGLHGGSLIVPERDELELAARVLKTQPKLLYARVDVARDGEGRPRLMELELIEPSLFLDAAPKAAERFVEALLRAR